MRDKINSWLWESNLRCWLTSVLLCFSVATIPVPDSDPPPYEVVVRLPPSYISREPPPYCEIDIDKYPSPLICPRQPGNIRTAAETSTVERAAPSRESTNLACETTNNGQQAASSGQEVASSGQEVASSGQEASSCGQESSGSHAEAPAASREAASAGAGASNPDLALTSSCGEASPCVTELTVISEVRDTPAATASGSESAPR